MRPYHPPVWQEVMASHTGCDKQDPHAHLTGGAFARADLLEHAIKVAVATLPAAPADATQ